MTIDPYVDTTGLLLNKLGVNDAEQLDQAVADISAARLEELALRPLPGAYNLDHLKRFHKKIFSDIFAWDGQIRTVQISKMTGFCLPQHIEAYAEAEFAKLARDNHLRNLARQEFIEKLAYYHAEVNEMHPFREGNGRTQRAFFRQLAMGAGYRIDWTGVDVDENITTAVEAHQGNLEPLAQLFSRIVLPIHGR